MGWWTSDDLVRDPRLARHREGAGGRGARAASGARRCAPCALRRNSRAARGAASRHYDPATVLLPVPGPSLTYSCAVFEHPGADLEEAQAPSTSASASSGSADHVLRSAAAGAASPARHAPAAAASPPPISPSQHELARELAAAGLGDRSRTAEDYRGLSGQYGLDRDDRGRRRRPPRRLLRRLQPASPEARWDTGDRCGRPRPRGLVRNVDFIKRYIFRAARVAGRDLPLAGGTTPTCVTHRGHHPHYARRWRAGARGWREPDAMRALGLRGRFLRVWDYYLACCEGAFRELPTAWCRRAGAGLAAVTARRAGVERRTPRLRLAGDRFAVAAAAARRKRGSPCDLARLRLAARPLRVAASHRRAGSATVLRSSLGFALARDRFAVAASPPRRKRGGPTIFARLASLRATACGRLHGGHSTPRRRGRPRRARGRAARSRSRLLRAVRRRARPAAAGGAAGRVRPGARQPALPRAMLFFVWYLGCEVLGLLGAFALARPAGAEPHPRAVAF
jgi:cyclopropane-fatty-acyl-phospholipid synthase